MTMLRKASFAMANSLLLCCAGAFASHAADTSSSKLFTVGRYLELQTASAPQVSPDGTQVLYTRSIIDVQNDKQEQELWIVGIDGKNHRTLGKGSGAVWSPDSKSIAFLAPGEPKGPQIFVLHLSVPGPPTQITRVQQAPSSLHWSPDGKQIG